MAGYSTGIEFFKDLLFNYGSEEAVKIANSYLDLQIKNKDPEEFSFCCDLYNAIKNHDEV